MAHSMSLCTQGPDERPDYISGAVGDYEETFNLTSGTHQFNAYAIIEAEAKHTREEKTALQLEVAAQKKMITTAEDVRRSEHEAAAVVREERSVAVTEATAWQAEARVRAEALERVEARVAALDAALDAGRGAVGQERQWHERALS